MKTAKNDVTGDSIKTRPVTDSYQQGWERIFGNKDRKQDEPSIQKKDEGKDGVAEHISQ